ncbi:MAG: HD domain-containing protein [Candidatus Thorarchaeota archaeon]
MIREFEIIWEAINFAFIKYGNLKRKSGEIPYIIHPIRVAMILRAAGFSEFKDRNLMIAALFHDLLEDTNLSYEELKAEFGTEVASIVKELSKPKELSKDDWLRAFGTASKEAKLIKMADRIDNLLDMEVPAWTVEKQKSYAKQGLIILETCGKTNSRLAKELKDLIDRILNDF